MKRGGENRLKAKLRTQENITFAVTSGTKVIKLKSDNVADALLKFAGENGISYIIFRQSARSRNDKIYYSSIGK